jgi:hypothetical protein
LERFIYYSSPSSSSLRPLTFAYHNQEVFKISSATKIGTDVTNHEYNHGRIRIQRIHVVPFLRYRCGVLRSYFVWCVAGRVEREGGRREREEEGGGRRRRGGRREGEGRREEEEAW